MITLEGTLSKGYLSRTLGVAFDYDYYFNPEKRHEIDCRCNEYAAKQLPELNIFYSESNLGRSQYYSSNQVLVGGIQPNMLLGMLLDAEFIPHESMDASEPMESDKPGTSADPTLEVKPPARVPPNTRSKPT